MEIIENRDLSIFAKIDEPELSATTPNGIVSDDFFEMR